MVKKVKSASAASNEANHLAAAVKDSAQQIWLAGLGAFAKAQEEGSKVFEALVKEGVGLQKKTRQMTEAKLGEVTGKVSKAAGDIGKQATEGWDKLENVFEDRVARALNRMGMPTSKDIAVLMARVEQLNTSVQAMSGKTPAAKAAKVVKRVTRKIATPVAAAVKKPAAKRATRKAK
jgi:poly(hydroxyalkanoate) granule-associated protein